MDCVVGPTVGDLTVYSVHIGQQSDVSTQCYLHSSGLDKSTSFFFVACSITSSSIIPLYFHSGEKNTPHRESQLHLMMAKGWSTCRLCCSSFVTARRDHLSQQSYPALLPEHRQWIPAHQPRCYLCLTARKRKIKAQLQSNARSRLFPVSFSFFREELLPSSSSTAS